MSGTDRQRKRAEETLHEGIGFCFEIDRLIHETRTEHQHLVIFENRVFGRVMMLDGVTQLTTADEFIYHEMMAHVPLMALPRPRDVLIIGGGDGGVLREVLRHGSVRRAVLCEIDAQVIELAQRYFPEISDGAFADPRVEIVIMDGTRHVAETKAAYDAILVDSTDPVGPGAVLFTSAFYAACRKALKPGGVLVTQNGVPFLQAEELAASLGHFRALFADARAYLATTPTYVGGPMAYGWASDNPDLRQVCVADLHARMERLKGFSPRYYTPEVHKAAFALPAYVKVLVEGKERGAVVRA